MINHKWLQGKEKRLWLVVLQSKQYIPLKELASNEYSNQNITSFDSSHAKTVSKSLRPSSQRRRDNGQQLETEYQLGDNVQIFSGTGILESENQQQGSLASDEWMVQCL